MIKDKEFFWNHPEEEFKEYETSEYITKNKIFCIMSSFLKAF